MQSVRQFWNELRFGPLGLALACGVLWSGLFWWPLWNGGGLVGGDIYPYFMPQKQFYADELAQGTIPLWNNLVGFGYPQLAESQTGVFYPPHLLAYSCLRPDQAYVVTQLLHYLIAFVGAWLFARGIGLRAAGCVLVAIVYTYGWFPPRLCLEWAILGGAWLPIAAWGTQQWSVSGQWRWLGLIAAALTLQLLAGHFFMAFATLLLAGWLAVWELSASGSAADSAADTPKSALQNVPPTATAIPRSEPRKRATLRGVGLFIAVISSFLLAGVQLIPTWELKTLSQRSSVGGMYDPGYGAIPLPYLTQLLGFWVWYQDAIEINRLQTPGSSPTNQVEAHLYVGMLPLLLAIAAMIDLRTWQDRRRWQWILLAVIGIVLATDQLAFLTRRLPGFSFFTGPGRYGVLTTLALAVLAAMQLERWCLPPIESERESRDRHGQRYWFHRRSLPGLVAVLAILSLTTADLWITSRLVHDVYLVERAPLSLRSTSPLRLLLAEEQKTLGQPVRLFCRGANVATLLNVASTPVYLGLGPAAYSDPTRRMPEPLPFDEPPSTAQIEWLQRAGVTHILSFQPLDLTAWPVEPLGEIEDPFLSYVWGRQQPGQAPPLFFLSRLKGSRGRAAWLELNPFSPSPRQAGRPVRGPSIEFRTYQPLLVDLIVSSARGGRLVLTDLDYPGWQVELNGAPHTAVVIEGQFRGVDLPPGQHRVTWRYQPLSVWIGGGLSLMTLIAWLALGHVRFWHPEWLHIRRMNRQPDSGPQTALN